MIMTINCSSESLKAYSFMRAAVYARYSTIMQRRRSLEDQTSSCKEYADSVGWTISDEHIYTDSAKSGTSTAGRDAFADLKEAAAQNPPPFDAVLFDDTSRCARDVEEILSFTKLMKFYKIRVHFVSQRLDSSDMNFDMSLHMYAMFDSQLVSKIRTRVMLTQRYLVKEGFNVGSVAYGYKSVAILSADHEKMVGRGKIIGSKLVKIEEHAEVVIYIFQCFADGQTMMGIAKSLNRKMIPSPTNAKAGKSGSEWTPDAIKDILANEKYKGWNVFNRSEQEENPETKKIRKTIKPAHEHIRVYLEHIRIVSDELWQKVADRLAMMADAQTRRVLGGYNRATKQAYLYSGFLFCGHCKSKLVIGGKQGKGRYRCPSYRTRRGCSNSIALSEQILAEQITEVLAKQLLIPSNFDVLIKEVYGELQLALQNQLKSVSQDQLAELQAGHQKIALAIELLINLIEQGGSPSLVHRLGEREAQKTQLEQKIVLLKGKKNLSITPETLEAVVRENIAVLVDVLRTNVPLARLVLEQHLLKMSVFYDSKENPNMPSLRERSTSFKASTPRKMVCCWGIRVPKSPSNTQYLLTQCAASGSILI
jgi:site-specific DNA recombinase